MTMNLLRVALVSVLFVVIGYVQTFAQDPHFSQYQASPFTLNPAQTGVFSGNYRATAIFRSQWNSVLADNPQDKKGVPMYRTTSASFDIRTHRGFTDQDAFGVGLMFLNDVAGAAKFSSNTLNASFSYIKALNDRENHFISGGIQAGVTQRSIDYTNLRFGSQFDGEDYNPAISSGENLGTGDQFLFADVSAGAFWYYVKDERTNFYAGLSTYHVNRPDQSFYGTEEDVRLFPRINFHGGMKVGVGNQTDLLPKLLFMKQGPAYETNIGSYLKFFFQQRSPLGNAFYVGPFYRIVSGNPDVTAPLNSESLILATKVDYGNLSIGLSYDLNFSELTRASSARGGFEVSLVYIGDFPKRKANVKFCPRF